MPDDTFNAEAFKDKLDACHDWPCDYTFKFIAGQGMLDTVRVAAVELLDEPELSTRASSGGRWVSLTVTARVDSAQAVVEVYERMARIEGIIAL